MRFSTTPLFVAAMLGVAQAQTPPNFTPAVQKKLEVMFNATSVKTPGEILRKTQTASQPMIAVADSTVTADKTYVFVMMDLDVPGEGKNITRRILLHCMNTGFKATGQKMAGGATVLASTEKGPAAYIAPSPPATDSTPHRYVELLFEQPAGLAVKESDFANTAARFNFDINNFATQNKLGAPIAANFFMVDGKANIGTPASNTPARSGSAGMPSMTPTPFTGAAAGMDIPLGVAGVLGGLLVAAL